MYIYIYIYIYIYTSIRWVKVCGCRSANPAGLVAAILRVVGMHIHRQPHHPHHVFSHLCSGVEFHCMHILALTKVVVPTRSAFPGFPPPPTCTLHPAPCTLHPAPYTLHPTPYRPAPYTLHSTPYTLHSTSYTPPGGGGVKLRFARGLGAISEVLIKTKLKLELKNFNSLEGFGVSFVLCRDSFRRMP